MLGELNSRIDTDLVPGLVVCHRDLESEAAEVELLKSKIYAKREEVELLKTRVPELESQNRALEVECGKIAPLDDSVGV